MGFPKIYVASPNGARTGGPEGLHQFADAVRQRGIEAFMVPLYNFRGRRPDPEYDIYDYEVAERIPRSDDSFLVTSEVSPLESLRELRATPNERTWMWWLSVHNSPDPRARYFRGKDGPCLSVPRPDGAPRDAPAFDLAAGTPPIPPDALDVKLFPLVREANRRMGPMRLRNGSAKAVVIEAAALRYNKHVIESSIGFMAQSVYAQGFCASVLGRKALPMTDYLRRPEIVTRPRLKNVVLYNGAKGYSKVPELIELLPDIEFRPIQNMTYLQVCEALAEATAYVELGVMPGRDRLPREAAHFGTPVVLLCRGAAYCWDDFPLDAKFRIADEPDWAIRMKPVLEEVVANSRKAIDEQQAFREWVAGDRDRFGAEVDHWLEVALKRT
jgi:hypothetical protein